MSHTISDGMSKRQLHDCTFEVSRFSQAVVRGVILRSHNQPPRGRAGGRGCVAIKPVIKYFITYYYKCLEYVYGSKIISTCHGLDPEGDSG